MLVGRLLSFVLLVSKCCPSASLPYMKSRWHLASCLLRPTVGVILETSIAVISQMITVRTMLPSVPEKGQQWSRSLELLVQTADELSLLVHVDPLLGLPRQKRIPRG